MLEFTITQAGHSKLRGQLKGLSFFYLFCVCVCPICYTVYIFYITADYFLKHTVLRFVNAVMFSINFSTVWKWAHKGLKLATEKWMIILPTCVLVNSHYCCVVIMCVYGCDLVEWIHWLGGENHPISSHMANIGSVKRM